MSCNGFATLFIRKEWTHHLFCVNNKVNDGKQWQNTEQDDDY